MSGFIHNPNFTPPNQGRINSLQGQLNAYLNANAGLAKVDFDDIRLNIGPANLTDGEIAQAAQNLGLTIE